MKTLFLPLAATLCLAAGSALAQDAAPGTAPADSNGGKVVTFINNQGEDIGTATLTEEEDGVKIDLSLKGLTPGEHGFHIHEKGDCSPLESFENAGGHFNPGNAMHGLAAAGGPHAGDMINIQAGEDGTVTGDVVNTAVTLNPKEISRANLLDEDGSALVVHAGVDDYASQPSGNAGGRVACAVIK